MHRKIKEASKVHAQDIRRGHRAITKPAVVSGWSENDHSLGGLAKSVLGVTKRTKNKYPTYVTHILYSKFKHNVDLQEKEERTKCKTC